MNFAISHIKPYELMLLVTGITAFNFALLLWFTKGNYRVANRFLAFALLIIGLQMAGIPCSLALAPLIYLYVIKQTRPALQFQPKHLLHLLPLILETFAGPYLPLLTVLSVFTYVYLSHREIEQFYRRQRFNELSDRSRKELSGLKLALHSLSVIWLGSPIFSYANILDDRLPYMLSAVILAILAGVIVLKPGAAQAAQGRPFRPLLPVDLKQKGTWLKEVMQANLYFRDPDLTLRTLAETLELTPNELSRIINQALRKSFNDFLSEYRVADVVRKMQDPANDHLTLLGIAYDAGFNSKSTFNRVFREITSLSPAEYKSGLKKDGPKYTLRPFVPAAALLSNRKLNRNAMFQNYVKIAWRNMLRNKGYTALNISGLVIGIACAGLIFLWVGDEASYDNFNLKKDRLYVVKVNVRSEGNQFTMGSTPRIMGKTIHTDIPGIAAVCRLSDQGIKSLFRIGDKSLYATGRYADPTLFRMFTLPFIEGNAQMAFAQLRSVVLTEKTARNFFGDDKKVVGKTVRMDNQQDYVVSGLIKDIPENSSLQADWFAPYDLLSIGHEQDDQAWNSYGPFTYVELDAHADLQKVNALLQPLIHHNDASQTNTAFLYPMSRWHLYDQFTGGKENGSGRIGQVRLLSMVAWIILLIACINFMNLATARSEQRAKEVGVRKVLGSDRKRLVLQFLTESLVLSAIATAIALGVILLALPAFNSLVEKDLDLGLNDPVYWLAIAAIILIAGLLAGSYPSLYLSSFEPVKVLKGFKIKGGGAAMVRKGLVVLQFTVSVVFIICTIITYQQIQHVRNRNLGFNKDNLVEIDLQHAIGQSWFPIRQQLLATGAVANAALADHAALYGGNSDNGFTWDGKKTTDHLDITFRNVSPEFISTAGLHLAAGRDFVDVPADTASVIVTQALADHIDKDGVTGDIIRSPRGMPEHTYKNLKIVGVVQNYVLGNIYDNTGAPVIFVCSSASSAGGALSRADDHLLYVRLSNGKAPQQALATISAVIQKNNPGYPFQYRFVDDQFNEAFKTELQTSTLSGVFASLAIVISCLGLFSLAAFMAERRIKEISVRKVLGASVSGLAALLSKDFMQLVGISCLVAFPIAWYVMHNWLESYAYRISIQWWIFASAGLAAMLIALATVSFQAVRAALANPVKSLRSE